MEKKRRIFSSWQDSSTSYVDEYRLDAVEDAPDLRDFVYQPALVSLKGEIQPPSDRVILDQGQEGACTGFGLAAVVNLLLYNRGNPRRVSARMLYEMARKFDEWAGVAYSGSSCRGAIRGWYNMGVCSEELAPYRAEEEGWRLTIDQAKDARKTAPGAYYRLSKKLSDYHAALNEVEAIYVSARVHEGWQQQNARNGKIPYMTDTIGGHAFAIVGYNSDGFFVQNSWGANWGDQGVALWTYEDWLANIQDGWVVRLALETPQVWHLSPGIPERPEIEEGLFERSPKRSEILGHFVHIDDGEFDEKGKYGMDFSTIADTANRVAVSDKYEHLLLYAHGGLNSITASARRIVAMKEVFKNNSIYPFHFMYDTGLLEELKDVVLGKCEKVDERAAGFSDFSDMLVEKMTRPLGRALWREMKSGATKPFEAEKAGHQTIRAFLEAFAADQARPKKVHLVGHSTGAILLAYLLRALEGFVDAPRIETCTLYAPACSHDIFKDIYRPLLHRRDADSFGINRMVVYNLSDELEQEDTVTPLYRKSLLYLVSNAFEDNPKERILGMQKFYRYLRNLPGSQTLHFAISEGSSSPAARTGSRTHGGFDNDVNTLNDTLKTILRKTPQRLFTKDDLDY